MKNVGTYVPYVKQLHCCTDCNTKKYFDPYLLWDQFPCPPPWNQALFLKLPWKERFGEEEGELLSTRVANRCGLDLNKLKVLPGSATRSLLVSDCDLKCFVLIAAFICIFIVALVAAVLIIKKRGLHTVKFRKSSRSDGAVDQTSYPTQYGFPRQKQTEVILADGDVQTRLINPEYDQGQRLSRLNQYTADIPRDNMYDMGLKRPQLSSEETSAFYSGTDTTHTYDSLQGSSRSGSVRLSDTIQRRFVIPVQSENYNPNESFENVSLICPCEKCSQIREIYSAYNRSNSPRGSVGQCSCTRCSQNRLYQSEIYYGSDNNPYFESRDVIENENRKGMVSDTETLKKHNKRRRKRKNKEAIDCSNKSDNDIPKTNSQELYSRPDESYNLVQSMRTKPQSMCMCERCVQIRENMQRAYKQGGYIPQHFNRCRCSCIRCSELNETFSNGYPLNVKMTQSAGSEFYEIPKRGQGACECNRCSQTNLQSVYSQNSVEIPSDTDTFPLKAFVPQAEVNFNDTNEDHRKRRRSKGSRPNSIIASSSDTNTGSEKSYRVGVPRTNGSLYRTKFMY